MLVPTLKGWNVETVGDDIAWMKFGEDGRPAIGQAASSTSRRGTSPEGDRNAIATVSELIFTNCARTDDGDVWWEGLTRGLRRPT